MPTLWMKRQGSERSKQVPEDTQPAASDRGRIKTQVGWPQEPSSPLAVLCHQPVSVEAGGPQWIFLYSLQGKVRLLQQRESVTLVNKANVAKVHCYVKEGFFQAEGLHKGSPLGFLVGVDAVSLSPPSLWSGGLA